MSDLPTPADLGVGLDDLIDAVRTVAPDDAITRLRAAMRVSDQLGELGDHLVGHFVDEARDAGASWREIGEGMGVTKQAAQKRFVPTADEVQGEGFLSRFTPRAQHVLAAARDAAREAGSPQVRTEHLVVGLVADGGGLSAQALAAQGVRAEQVRAAVARVAHRPQEVPDHVPFATEAKKVLAGALREAFRMRHNYIGTEHLLLGLLADRQTTGARILRDLGVTQDRTAEWIEVTIAEIVAKRSG